MKRFDLNHDRWWCYGWAGDDWGSVEFHLTACVKHPYFFITIELFGCGINAGLMEKEKSNADDETESK